MEEGGANNGQPTVDCADRINKFEEQNRLVSMPRSKIKAHTQKDNLVLKKKLNKLDIQIGYAGTGTL